MVLTLANKLLRMSETHFKTRAHEEEGAVQFVIDIISRNILDDGSRSAIYEISIKCDLSINIYSW